MDRCITVETPYELADALVNKTIWGDTFDVMPLLPSDMVDLAIVDPPYNLTKEYHGTVFSRRSSEEYEAYTRKWLRMVYPLVKENGSIYVCCDWESSLTIGRVLGEFFHIRSRITWQREKVVVQLQTGRTEWKISGLRQNLISIPSIWMQ